MWYGFAMDLFREMSSQEATCSGIQTKIEVYSEPYRIFIIYVLRFYAALAPTALALLND